ncbi:ParB/RepB/Spo0J family partition protein [Aestuariicoccus sp. MJ-SS9]|uniref:ParB/RepB/Spo0J family partition protein n=1 Tax=Aestuariicoccus sp. MJ-SS9 TaxID=3079855 RepID=UPI0029061FBB|nr:ParB/RepB/Spo0J family partition protein [Aestuariicoccus sp. MJ-SS9]MDU8910906.1 ParB/RepB/Spo0J family partition protein [Aestuariicoccus sp. MJ-SS9]
MADRKEARRGLGRGLSALMADVDPQTASPAQGSAGQGGVTRIPIEGLEPNLDQPRRSFDEDRLAELSESIRAKGVLQPLIVRRKPGSEDTYQIVAGERRWRAAQRAQLHELPVLVREFTDTEVLEVAIIENIQRADLNPIEEAAGYKQLMSRFGHTQEQMAEALGKSRSHIANLLRLLNLPDSVQKMVMDGVLSAGHARTLVTAEKPEELAQRIATKGLSVREAEKLAKAGSDKGEASKKPGSSGVGVEKDADTKALEGDLSAALGMKVYVDHKPGGESGRVTISYDTLEQLDSLCMILSRGD